MKVQFLDLEMLCWPGGICPNGQNNHIIQLGIVEVESETLIITRKKDYFIRPHYKDFEINPYCTELTGITHSQLISSGRYFPEVIRSIKKEFAPQNKITYSWGSDYDALAKHCCEYDTPNPWAEPGIDDFGIFFRSAYNQKHKLPLNEALKYLGLTFEGLQHNALNDAQALAHLYIETIKRIRSYRPN